MQRAHEHVGVGGAAAEKVPEHTRHALWTVGLLLLGLALALSSTAIVVQQASFACLLWMALYFRSFEGRFPATLTAAKVSIAP